MRTGTVNTAEIVNIVSERMSCYKKDTKTILSHFNDVICEYVLAGEKVHLSQLGTFYLAPARRERADGTRRMVLKFRASRKIEKRFERTGE